MTTHLELPYGKGKISFDLPLGWEPDYFRPSSVLLTEDPQREILQSLQNPLGDRSLDNFSGVQSASIAISDETRLIPYHLILPPIFEQLDRIGIAPSAIWILIASGLHPPMAASRFPNLLSPEILRKYSVVAHDAKLRDLKFLGNTVRGTPVFVNPIFHQADLRIVIGLIDPHQFVGYTGGVKGAAIGLAGLQTIEANHSMLFQPQAVVGEIRNNPVRQDIEEIGRMIGVHWVVNAVLNETNGIVKIFCGDPIEVERIGSEFCRTIYETKSSKEYDVVLASPGGYPKDINIYQAQKALAHVTPLVRQGGDIFFFAECPDGHGDEAFYRMMAKNRSPQEVIEHFRNETFRMGDHKAFLWCRSLIKAKVHLYSSVEEELSRTLMTLPVKTFREAFERISAKYVTPPLVAVMPKASSTYVKIHTKGK
ncbi:MAG TPA: nickel-dependent lactate racemase [Thermodesulfobacteriota bacterium]|nr:nickel-dependent lactate racemase [Thermodesulfobacteriota bacterium]